MRFIAILTIAVMAIVYLPLSATIISVPDDYGTIQEGIDASSDGDTVLVQPGTYVENINFNGHNIVLGSLFLTTEDDFYVTSTIINGSSVGSVITIENNEDSTTMIIGFTIINGHAHEGAGIYCKSNIKIFNNIITENEAGRYYEYPGYGAGIYCEYSNPIIMGNIIYKNTAIGWGTDGRPVPGFGAGILCGSSEAMIINNIIYGNYLSIGSGGGIHCSESNPVIKNNIIMSNESGEISLDENSTPEITYCDIRNGWVGEGNIDEDPLFIDPLNYSFNVCSQSPCIDTGDPAIIDPDNSRSDIGLYYQDHSDCVFGNVWHVAITGSDSLGNGSPQSPYRTIQHSINTALHNDTIFINNGNYEENVGITYKKIHLVSNYINTGNAVDIASTVIYGNFEEALVTIEHCDSAVSITGITLRDGRSDGIMCSNSSFSVSSSAIISCSGAGIKGAWSYPYSISGCIIYGNAGTGVRGEAVINNSIIWGNSPETHGYDIEATYSDIRGGVEGEGNIDSDPLFVDPFTTLNVFSQSPCIDAGDPSITDPDSTISDIGIFYPDHPDFSSGRMWYVSMDGDDYTGDGSMGFPFRTIQRAIDISQNTDTVITGNGTYDENIHMVAKDIIIASYYLITQNSTDIENTIIDGNSQTVIYIDECDSSSEIRGFTLSNGISGIECNSSNTNINNNIIVNNSIGIRSSSDINVLNNSIHNNDMGIRSDGEAIEINGNVISENYGPGIYAIGSYPYILNNYIGGNDGNGIFCGVFTIPTIFNNQIIGNSSDYGGGIKCGSARSLNIHSNYIAGNCADLGGGIYMRSSSGGDRVLKHNVIVNNLAFNDGGGLYLDVMLFGPSHEFENNVFYNNWAQDCGGGIYIERLGGNLIMTNSILRENYATHGWDFYNYPHSPDVTYCNIIGSYPGEGNIDVDPLFRDPVNGDFHLMATYCRNPYDSPCIDAGDPSIIDSLLSCSWGLGDDRSDMGAYGGGDSLTVGIEELVENIPQYFALSQNYPNPFNATTTIQYNLPIASDLTIEIYNILGRKVETLLNEPQPAGYHQIIWKAKDVSSGIYFYRLQASDYTKTRKMLLLK